MNPSANQPGRHRVVSTDGADERVFGDAGLKLALGCGKRIRQRPEVGLLHPVRVDDPSAYPAMMPGEGFVPGPGVVLGLEIVEIREGA